MFSLLQKRLNEKEEKQDDVELAAIKMSRKPRRMTSMDETASHISSLVKCQE